MKVRLSVQHKKANVKSVILHTDALIGRSTECNLRLASGQVSRRHCKLLISDEQVAVVDLGSSNGTFLNDEKITSKVEIPIPPGSALSIGPARFIVEYEDPAAETHIRKGASAGASQEAGSRLSPEETPTADAIPVHSPAASNAHEAADPEADLEISDEELEALLAEEGFDGADSPGIDFPLEDDSESGASPTSDTIPYTSPEDNPVAREEFSEESSTLHGSESNSNENDEDGDEDVMKFLQDL